MQYKRIPPRPDSALGESLFPRGEAELKNYAQKRLDALYRASEKLIAKGDPVAVAIATRHGEDFENARGLQHRALVHAVTAELARLESELALERLKECPITRTAKAAYQYPASGGCIELPGYPGGGIEWGSADQAYVVCTASLKLFCSEVAVIECLLGIPAEKTYTRHEARAAWYPTSYENESRIARGRRVLQRGLQGLPAGTYEANIGAITYAGTTPWVHRCKLLCDLIPSINYVGEYARGSSTLLGLQGFRVLDGLVSPVIGVLTTSHQVSPQHIHDVLPEAVYPATAENGDCQRCNDAECPTRGARTACHFHTSLPAYYLLMRRRPYSRRSLQVLAHKYLCTRGLDDCAGKRA